MSYKLNKKGNELGYINISEDGDCEHCRQLEPFTPMWADGGTWWCLHCALSFDECELTEDDVAEINTKAKEMRLEYYRSKVKELE